MNVVFDILLIAAIAALLVNAVVSVIRQKKNGRGCCGGNCSSCKGCKH